jgi:PPOX class probable F420-dependent enzyme
MSDLEHARYLDLATFRKNGAAVETPVWFAASGSRLYVFTAGDAGKVKRLRRSARARIARCDVRGKRQGPWIEAHAHIVTDPAVIERAHAALRTKYGVQMHLLDLLSWASGRIRNRAWVEIEPVAS